MKKFLALAALISVGSVNAEELKFGDLNYFLEQGKYNVGADVIVHNENSRAGGTTEGEFDAYLVNTHFGYALSNNFNLVAELDYIYNGSYEVTGSASTETDGLQNPRLGANLRVLEQKHSGINLDVGAIASVKVTDREAGSPSSGGNMFVPFAADGSMSEPRNGVDLSVRAGQKWNEANEFYVLAGANYHMDGDFDQKGGDSVDVDSSLDFKVGGFYQYRPVHEFMMTVGVMGTRFGEVDGKDGTTSFTITEHKDYRFLFNAKYLVSDNTIVKFLITKDRRNDYDIKTAAGNAEIDKRNALQYGLGVDFLF